VKDWYSDNKKVILGDPPKDSCSQDDFPGYKPSLTISTSGDTSSSSITLSVSIDAPYGVKSVTYEVDGKDAGTSTSKPYSISYDIPLDKNNSTISVGAKLEDANGNTATASQNITVHY
jgi:hypothetical protein